MDRFQVITNVKCPEHKYYLYVIVTFADNGDFDVWKGCPHCHGNERLKREVVKQNESPTQETS